MRQSACVSSGRWFSRKWNPFNTDRMSHKNGWGLLHALDFLEHNHRFKSLRELATGFRAGLLHIACVLSQSKPSYTSEWSCQTGVAASSTCNRSAHAWKSRGRLGDPDPAAFKSAFKHTKHGKRTDTQHVSEC